MKVVYFDCAAGAAGDMVLGALVDLGLPFDELKDALSRLSLTGYELQAQKVRRGSISATKVDVVIPGAGPATHAPDQRHSHDHAYPHHHHDHGYGHGLGHEHEHEQELEQEHGNGYGHEYEHGHDHAHAHTPRDHSAAESSVHVHSHAPQRGLREIIAMIDGSDLEAEVKDRSRALFARLAEAEAAAHGTRQEDVHFHEVGAVDSIIDIVGSVYGLLKLKADRFVASPLNVGSGTVKVAHGVLPVPAPATARLLRGVPAYGEGAGELLTPTGALLITDFACEYGTLPAMAIEGIGYGAGTREIEGRPNVLRILSGTAVAATARERVVVLECEIDDLSPQVFGTLIEHLLKAGALDAYLTAISMKKGRPGILVTAIADPAREDAIAEVLFSETTTLGLRRLPWERTVLDRETIAVSTRYGELTMKIGCRAGRVYNVQPEFDECVKAAQAHGVPVKEVWAEAVSAYRQSASARR